MNCVCGCGIRLGRNQTELNFLAAEVAIELVVWDKARALRSPVAAEEIEMILGAGAPHYQALLTAIHADTRLGEEKLEVMQAWVDRSQEARRRLGNQLPVVPKNRIKLNDEDQARVNRLYPELTFTGTVGPGPTDGAELEALLVSALEEVRSGRVEDAEQALRRYLAERS